MSGRGYKLQPNQSDNGWIVDMNKLERANCRLYPAAAGRSRSDSVAAGGKPG